MKRKRLTREEGKQQTKDRLLEAALEVFSRYGYEGASVDRIADHAGYTKGAFYSNFDSKEGIFLNLMEDFYRREVNSLKEFLAEETTAETLLVRIKSFYTQLESETDWGVLSAGFQLQASRDAAFAKRFGQSFNTHRDALAKLLRDLYGKVGRSIPMDSKELANVLMGMAVGLALQRVATSPRRGYLGDAILFVLRDLRL
jgi:AcrR family transcriptional regulator